MFLLRSTSRTALSNRVSVATRIYSSTRTVLDEESVAVQKKDLKEEKIRRKLEARDYNNRRAAYNRQVSALRRQYALEVEQQKKADEKAEEELRKKLTQQRLKRQRLKNIRSAQHALREKELREERARQFNKHLEEQQKIRDAKNERFAMARQLVIDELEKEAPLWLTTREEVEAAFTHEAGQLLWARPGGVLGAPNPSLDCHFWQFESHTWHMNKTYKSQREILLDELQEMVYEEANIDPDFWTPERIAEADQKEQKAKLRAMVNTAGRAELLRKQRQMLEEDTVDEDGIPKPRKVPNRRILQNDRALEAEGAKLLMEDPTKFFVFEKETENREVQESSDGSSGDSTYSGPTLGAPVRLRDHLREQNDGEVFPRVIGKLPKPDTRTEREKKLAEREERLWAAAEAQRKAEAAESDTAGIDDDDDDLGPDIDYNELDWDSDDEEWVRGLDPSADKEIYNTPRDRRYTETDIEWVLETLDTKVKFQEQQFAQDMETIKQELRMNRRLAAESPDDEEFDESSVEAALLKLNDKALMALSDLDEKYAASEGNISDTEIQEAMKDIPGITEQQIKELLQRDRSEI